MTHKTTKNKILLIVIFLCLCHLVFGKEKLIPINPDGEPNLVASSKAAIQAEFTDDVKISILSAKEFSNEAWNLLFPNSSPLSVKAVITHPATEHGTVIEFIVSLSETKYVIARSVEPSSFTKALVTNKKRVSGRQDAEIIARAFAALCKLNVVEDISIEQSSKGYSMVFSTQLGRGDNKISNRFDLNLNIDSVTNIVSSAVVKTEEIKSSGNKIELGK